MNRALPFAVVSVAGTALYLAIFVALHILPTGYNPIRHAVSDSAVGRSGGVVQRRPMVEFSRRSRSRTGARNWCRIAAGNARVDIPRPHRAGAAGHVRVPDQSRRTAIHPHCRTAVLHYGFAILAFVLTYLAISKLNTPLTAITPWRSVARPLNGLAWLITPTLAAVVITMLPLLRRIFGLLSESSWSRATCGC
jgi:hypothetical protein